MKKTNEEIDALKRSWLKDPCWDIEKTDGFEEHEAELRAWHEQKEIDWQLEEEERITRRARVMEIETGITATGSAQHVRTYSEIETIVERQTSMIYNVQDLHEQLSLTLAQAQIHATLLLAAQIQRVADLLEEKSNSNDMSESVQLWRLQK